jgi:hypothetical protein
MMTIDTTNLAFRCVMMIGPPASGKSYFLCMNRWMKNPRNAQRILSPCEIRDAIYKDGADVAIDDYNLTVAQRKRYLQHVPLHYERVAVVCAVPFDTLYTRLATHKIGDPLHPSHRQIQKMIRLYQEPTFDEFDRIIYAIDS